MSQRPTYKISSGKLETNIEFELSRLIEKEVHYHIKVEEEKNTLERHPDFNTMACFTVLDHKNHGYVDFEQLYIFMRKYDEDADMEVVNAILRRFKSNDDFKISFREFSFNITPIIPGLTP